MSENNKNGFIDFNQNLAAFKLEVLNQNFVQLNKLSYVWEINDSSGTVFAASQLSIYKNSIGVPTAIMSTNTIYTIQVNVTDGNYVGYMKTQY